jgi:hypothetical protein
MALGFTVFPPDDLSKLDKEKRQQLANAIRNVLKTDPEVQKLLKDKTWNTYNALLGSP